MASKLCKRSVFLFFVLLFTSRYSPTSTGICKVTSSELLSLTLA